MHYSSFFYSSDFSFFNALQLSISDAFWYASQLIFWRCELLLRGLCCANTSCALKPPPYFLCIWLGFMSLWLCESEMTMQLNSLYYSFAGKRFSKYDEDLSVGGINEKELNSMNKHIPGNFTLFLEISQCALCFSLKTSFSSSLSFKRQIFFWPPELIP